MLVCKCKYNKEIRHSRGLFAGTLLENTASVSARSWDLLGSERTQKLSNAARDTLQNSSKLGC